MLQGALGGGLSPSADRRLAQGAAALYSRTTVNVLRLTGDGTDAACASSRPTRGFLVSLTQAKQARFVDGGLAAGGRGPHRVHTRRPARPRERQRRTARAALADRDHAGDGVGRAAQARPHEHARCSSTSSTSKPTAQTSQRYEIEFWRKVFYPLSCLVMVVLALPFAYLHFRQAGITTYVFGGVLIGISFFLLNNVFGYIGNLQNWHALGHGGRPADLHAAVAGRLRLAGAAALSHGKRDRPVRPMARATRCGASRWRRWRRRMRTRAPGRARALRLPGTGRARPAQPRPATDRRGADHVHVVPMFLGTGRHAREDLPPLIDALRVAHPVVFRGLQKPVGEDGRVSICSQRLPWNIDRQA
jgi:hypothetical protein